MANLTNLYAGTEPRTPYSAGEGNVNTISVQFDVGTDNLNANDEWHVIRLPADASIIHAAIEADDLDTDGTPAIVLDLGITGDSDAIIDGATVAQAGGYAAATAIPLGPQAADYDVFVTVQVAPDAAQAGTARVDLTYIRTATTSTSEPAY